MSAAGGDSLYCTAGAGPGGSLEWLLDEPGFSEEEEGFFILMKRASIIINLWQTWRGGRSQLGLPGAWLRRSSWLQRADVCRTPRPLAAAPKLTRPPHGRRSCSRTSTRLSHVFLTSFCPRSRCTDAQAVAREAASERGCGGGGGAEAERGSRGWSARSPGSAPLTLPPWIPGGGSL